MKKAELRKIYLDKRMAISRGEYWQLSDDLVSQLDKLDLTDVSTIHCFLPIRKHNEVDTFSVLEFFKKKYPEIRIVIPRTNFEKLSIENVIFDPIFTILGRNKYDIPEPIYGTVIDHSEVDLVFVPLLVADEKGNRAGYGKGFYDRFLSLRRPDVRKIGLCYFEPIPQIEDTNEFDIPLDQLITPQGIWNFNAAL